MRILTIGHSYVVKINRTVIARLAERNDLNLTVISPNFIRGDLRPIQIEPRDTAEKYHLIGVDCRFNSRIHLLWYKDLKRTMRQGAYDLVHIWEEPYMLPGYQIARQAVKAGIPYFYKTDQNLVKRYPWPFSRFEDYCNAHAAGWVGCGQLVVESRLAKGYPRENARFIPYAVDERRFHPDGEAREQLCKQLDFRHPVIGYVGRLTEEKGLSLLMQVLPRIQHPFHFLVLGSGPLQETLKSWSSTHNIDARFMLVEHGEMPSYVRAMDFLVAPSQTRSHWKEQFGRMLIEAFASGVPVIGSDSGEIPHVIGQAGKIAPEGDTDAWVAAITEWLEDPEARRIAAEACHKRGQQQFSASVVADQYYEYYQSCV